MSEEQFKIAHQQFNAWTDELRVAARRLPDLSAGERLTLISDLVAFLHEDVEPHTRIDEQVLYPRAADRLGSPLVTAAMAHDHLAIRTWTAKPADPDAHLEGGRAARAAARVLHLARVRSLGDRLRGSLRGLGRDLRGVLREL